MKRPGWPTFSFTEVLRPPDGWETEHALLTTYSADLVVLITALLSLAGADLDHRRTGSRVEVVKAIEALRSRVRVLAQANRIAIPRAARPILKLLDTFVCAIPTDERMCSWHPKVSLVCYRRIDDPRDRFWRLWLGSRNLTRAMNWEAGLVLASRSDGAGDTVDGVDTLGRLLAERASLPRLRPEQLAVELAKLKWDFPTGCEVKNVRLFTSDGTRRFPTPRADTDRVVVISPFLDEETVRAVAHWGNPRTRRFLVSTAPELDRLRRQDAAVFSGFRELSILPLPDLSGEGACLSEEAGNDSTATELAEGEDAPPAGLHAKLFFAAKGPRRELWIGSANATARGWHGRNFEAVAETNIGRDAADALEDFVATCARFKASASPPICDEDEEALEALRKLLSATWPLRQHFKNDEVEVVAPAPPAVGESGIQVEVGTMEGQWKLWDRASASVVFSLSAKVQRCNFIQVRLSRGQRQCAWVQVAPCDPPVDESRDRAIIAQYLDARTFLAWIRSLLANQPGPPAGGDWDEDGPPPPPAHAKSSNTVGDLGILPTVEEILRSWARDPAGFSSANLKVESYLAELKLRAHESGKTEDASLLQAFEQTWNTLTAELR